jgi:hypothetical protein
VKWTQNEKLRVLFALACTLAVLYWIPYSLLDLIVLLLLWSILFHPWQPGEVFSFAIAALFFLVQNYVCLKAGIFEFKSKDMLLMPYYEPFLWGFYFTALKRFVSGTGKGLRFEKKSILAVAVTSLAFSLFSTGPSLLTATILSTALLFALFHTRVDIHYAACALVLGFIVELFGVFTGLWSYPAPDFLGIPYWFATMWISVGLLGCRFLIPLGEYMAERRNA